VTGIDPRARRRALIAIAAIAAVQALVVLAYLHVERSRAARADGGFAYERLTAALHWPGVELVRARGSPLATSELRGRPLLLHFWATWCAPCREELPSLLQLARSEPGLRVVALSLDSDWPAVSAFFSGAVPPEVVRDPSQTLIAAYGVNALPDSFLIAGDGVAKLRFRGARKWDSEGAREVLEPYLHP
jgi:thiol-disulfide isomerase/thioredoxin